jgi:hypothetical protein
MSSFRLSRVVLFFWSVFQAVARDRFVHHFDRRSFAGNDIFPRAKEVSWFNVFFGQEIPATSVSTDSLTN